MKKFLTLFVLVCPLLALAQQTRQITGQVLDRADGAPLVGATVFIAPEETQAKDYNPQGTIAYEQGRFAFKLPASVRKVVVSYLGYEARTLDISGKSDFTIYLSASDNKVDAVVVTGYQRIEKRKLTSSISSVKMSDISRDGVASVDEMLSGSIAGLVSTPTSGGPGAASKIKIRSTVTLNGNTDPLWVLDGMPLEGNDIPKDWSSKESVDNLYNMSIAGLNPWDIEDITVLKDAAATAIYGARAANGVIIITTKKGLRNQAMRVNVSASLFVTDRPDLSRLNLMNASQKVDLELGLAANARLNYLPGMGGVARILDKAGERPALVNGGSLASLSPETQSAIGALRRNGTDWGREIYRTALNQQYSVSISGGSGKTGYYFSGGYYNEQGTTVGTGFERLNLTMKTDYDLLQNLRFGASVFVGQNKNDSYLSDTDVFTNPSRYTRTVNPYLNAYNPDGSYAYDPDMTVNTGNTDVLDFNFLEERARTEYTLKTRSIKTIFDLDYRPVKGLKLYTQFGLQVDNSATEKMAQENTYFTRKYQLKSMVDQVVRLPKGGVIQNWNGDLSQYNWKAQAEYAGTFGGKHELDLMAGLEMRGVTNTTVHTKGFGYDHKTMTTKPINVPEDSDLLDDESFRQYTKSFYENRYMSYFFTGSYTYDNRYTVFGSMRYDGTNLFGVDPKYKFNPMWSISGAWSINRERFLRDARWLDNLRLRVSYGAQGNIDRTTSPYILGTWNSTSLGGASEDRIDVTSPPNQNLRWETTYSWNTALDFAAFEHQYRLHVRTLRTPKQGPDHHAHDPFGDGIHLDIEQLRRNLKQRYRIHAQHGERPHARLPLGDLDQHRPQYRQGRKGAYRRQQLEPLAARLFVGRRVRHQNRRAGRKRHSDVLARRKEDLAPGVRRFPRGSQRPLGTGNSGIFRIRSGDECIAEGRAQLPDLRRFPQPGCDGRFQQPVLLQEFRPGDLVQLRFRTAHDALALLQPRADQPRAKLHHRNEQGVVAVQHLGNLSFAHGQPAGRRFGLGRLGRESRSVQGLLLDHGQFPDKRQPVQQPRHLEQEDQLLPREQHPAGILLPAANHAQTAHDGIARALRSPQPAGDRHELRRLFRSRDLRQHLCATDGAHLLGRTEHYLLIR